jgi:hypothetical protein
MTTRMRHIRANTQVVLDRREPDLPRIHVPVEVDSTVMRCGQRLVGERIRYDQAHKIGRPCMDCLSDLTLA